MPIFRVTCRDESAGKEHTVFVEASDSTAAEGHLARHGFFDLRISQIAPGEIPPDQSLVRVRGPGDQTAPLPAPIRRLLLVVAGLGLSVVVILGVMFVMRAKEHLLRTDIRPNEPPRATPSAAPPPAPVAKP